MASEPKCPCVVHDCARRMADVVEGARIAYEHSLNAAEAELRAETLEQRLTTVTAERDGYAGHNRELLMALANAQADVADLTAERDRLLTLVRLMDDHLGREDGTTEHACE